MMSKKTTIILRKQVNVDTKRQLVQRMDLLTNIGTGTIDITIHRAMEDHTTITIPIGRTVPIDTTVAIHRRGPTANKGIKSSVCSNANRTAPRAALAGPNTAAGARQRSLRKTTAGVVEGVAAVAAK